jgi:hypothetical protein
MPLGFTDEHFPESSHICLIYENDAERQKIVSEFMAAGLNRKERVRYYTDVTPPENIRSWLLAKGVEFSKAEERGDFTTSPAAGAYCPGGHFEPKETIERMLQGYQQLKKAGYCGVRTSGEMSWVHRGIPGSERWLEYESLINNVDTDFPHIGMCQYDARKFDGATLFKVLQLHPYIVAGGMVVRNPYYIK